MIDATRRWKITAPLQLMPSGFLFNAKNGESYSLNATAICVFEALQAGGGATAAITAAAALVERFEVSPTQARWDALRFLSHLHTLGLVAEEKPAAPGEAGPDA